jgi:hypothetical protein
MNRQFLTHISSNMYPFLKFRVHIPEILGMNMTLRVHIMSKMLSNVLIIEN